MVELTFVDDDRGELQLNCVSCREVENSQDHFSMINNENRGSMDELSTLKRLTIGRSEAKRLHRKMKKYQIGEATDDVRLCIMCLRAIMNNQVNIFVIISKSSIFAVLEWLQSCYSTSICTQLHHIGFTT